jgi:hypothetical protein
MHSMTGSTGMSSLSDWEGAAAAAGAAADRLRVRPKRRAAQHHAERVFRMWYHDDSKGRSISSGSLSFAVQMHQRVNFLIRRSGTSSRCGLWSLH